MPDPDMKNIDPKDISMMLEVKSKDPETPPDTPPPPELKTVDPPKADPPPADPPPPEKKEDPPPPPEKKEEPPKEDPPPPPKVDDPLVVPDDLLADPPPPDPTPSSDELDLTGVDEKVKQGFIRMRQELAERDKKLAAYADVDPTSSEELKQAKAELDEANGMIEKLNLEASPRFKARFDVPRTALVDQAKGMLKEFGIEESVAEQAVGLGLRDRMELLNAKAPDAAAALAPIYTQIDMLNSQRDQMIANHRETLQALEAEQSKAEETEMNRIRMQFFNQSIDKLQKESHFAFMKVDGQEAHNRNVDALLGEAKQIFLSDDPSKQALALLQGVEAPIYLQLYLKERERRMATEKDLSAYTTTTPRLNSTGAPSAKTTPKPGDKMSAEDAADTVASKLGI